MPKQRSNPESHDVTDGDSRKMSKHHLETPPCQHPELKLNKTTIEMPVYTESALNPVSPGGGDVKRNIHHVYAQMLEFANGNTDFRLMVEKLKMGKMLEASLKDEKNVYKVTLVLAKPDITQAAKAKTGDLLDEMETGNTKKDPQVKPADNYDAHAAQGAETLWETLQGSCFDIFWSTSVHEQPIIDVLAYRETAQRLAIVKIFKTISGKDLIGMLDRKLEGSLKQIARGLCMSPADFDAMNINMAIKEPEKNNEQTHYLHFKITFDLKPEQTNSVKKHLKPNQAPATGKKVLIELFCTRNNQQIKDFKAAYKTMYGKDLKEDIAGDTSCHLNRLLDSLLQANRDESEEFDLNKAKQDVQELLEAGVNKWATDESRFNVILVSSSYAQLRATFQEYAKLAKKDIANTIQNEVSGDLKDSMLAIVRCIKNKASHFASELHRSMTGEVKDQDTVCRVIVSRFEVDMVQIKAEFQRSHNQTLGMFIASSTFGSYRTMLLALIRDDGALQKNRNFNNKNPFSAEMISVVEDLGQEMKPMIQ